MDWPGNSQDLSPIEILWAILKDKVADEHSTSAKELEMAIKPIWAKKITAEYCTHLLHSMPGRRQAVIKNEGGYIPNIRFLHKDGLI